MIIKVKGAHVSDSWRYYDNARALQSSLVGISQVPVVDGFPTDEQHGLGYEDDGVAVENMLVPRPAVISVKGQPANEELVLCLTFIDHSDHPHHLYVNTETYLLNDSGKTIERLY